ncbi:hypothetical protein STEG23_016280 [Scotinomys teguina]
MQPGLTTNTGGGTMEVVAAAPRCQLLLIMLMAAMWLPGMKGSPLLVPRTVTRTFELQESIGKGQFGEVRFFQALPEPVTNCAKGLSLTSCNCGSCYEEGAF